MLRNMNAASIPNSTDVRELILLTGQKIISGKGYSAVGLNEILMAAGVPKGSFYHYFGSKDAFGEALLESYFGDYLADLETTLSEPGLAMGQRLMNYWREWQDNQSALDCQGKCLAVKLGAEVSDLSESMRLSLKRGTSGIISRLTDAIRAGVIDGSISVDDTPERIAQSLYQLWLGASVMVKIVRDTQPFEGALAMTRQILHIEQ
ncbi:TetR family transcriptional regulator [Paraburkholderia caribensis]|nr:TetR family transcriptional regulator [Paraburkholderia caribensis]